MDAPTIMQQMAYARSSVVCGCTSPYPIVDLDAQNATGRYVGVDGLCVACGHPNGLKAACSMRKLHTCLHSRSKLVTKLMIVRISARPKRAMSGGQSRPESRGKRGGFARAHIVIIAQ